jgi:hypothetical protein
LFRNVLKHLSNITSGPIHQRIVALDELIRDGTAAHLPQARRAFSSFLTDITVRDDAFKNLPTWLIQTGDLTTYGDTESIWRGLSFLDRLRRETGVEVVSLHGNHDAWPCTLPICGIPRIPKHQQNLHTFFPDNWPRAPLTARLPDDSGEVQLYGIDTVDARVVQNTLARGEIPRTNLGLLLHRIRTHTKEEERQLRILVSHHPIRYPDPQPAPQMVLNRQSMVCNFLRTGDGSGVAPLAHLILSGHTHDLSPPIFALPDAVRACDQIPLGNEQCQLVVGSLSQLDPGRKHGALAHQCQVLRFYHDTSEPDIVLMQRIPASRQSGKGEGGGVGFGHFEIIDESRNGADSVQTMAFEL